MSLLRTLGPLALMAACLSPIVGCSQAAEGEDDYEDEGAIIGGRESGPADDAVVAIFRQGQPFCNGTLIADNVILTALHCVTEQQHGPTQTGVPMLGQQLTTSDLTIRAGVRPSSTVVSATVSKIVVPDPVRMKTQTVPITSNNIALLYIHRIDPAFKKVTPRRIATGPVRKGDTVTVIGYGGNSQDLSSAGVAPLDRTWGAEPSTRFLSRDRRDNVEVLAGPGQPLLPNEERVTYTNKRGEFVTDTVACGGDRGSPALDAQGNVVGIVSAVVGQCDSTSLSVFTDVLSHATFLRSAVEGETKDGCSHDEQCGGPYSGQICDTQQTRFCIRGCRAGGNGCEQGRVCSTQTNRGGFASGGYGAVGICQMSGTNPGGYGYSSDPMYDRGPYVPPALPNITCPGNPLCPTATTPQQRECQQDSDCGGQNGVKPRVCDIPMGRCLDSCRVATAGMCATGQTCVAFVEDPLLGQCSAPVPTPPAGTPPASAPTLQPEATPQAAATDPAATDPAATSTAAAAKKKKNKAKADDGGCSVAVLGGTSALSSALPFGLALLGMAMRRRRR